MKRVGGASPRSGRPYEPLKGRTAFRRAYRSAKRRRFGGVVVLETAGRPGRPQVGFVVGKRIGNAVERNRTKRRLREAAARVVLRDGTAYVVIALDEAVEAGFDCLVEWLEAAVASSRDESEM